MDEVSLGLEPPLRACWMKKGQQKCVPALQPGTKQHRHIFGAYCWNDDTIDWQMADWKNSETFIKFLEYLFVEKHPNDAIVLVMDNVSYHKSAAALAALSLFEHRALVVCLPPYCPELNLIERFWRHLKDLACANKLHDTIEAVVASAEYFLAEQNTQNSQFRIKFSKDL